MLFNNIPTSSSCKTRKFEPFEPIDYLVEGRNCVDVAFLLKDGPDKIKKNYPMRVLLIHGIELLLQAFICHFDKSKFEKGHDIKKFYNIAKKIDKSRNLNILTNELLNNAINKITANYYPDSIKARYKNTNSHLEFSIFMILRELLIQPLEKVIHL